MLNAMAAGSVLLTAVELTTETVSRIDYFMGAAL